MIDMFLLVSSSENGDVFALPYAVGPLQQPYKTLNAWRLMKGLLQEHIANAHKENMKKMKSKQRR